MDSAVYTYKKSMEGCTFHTTSLAKSNFTSNPSIEDIALNKTDISSTFGQSAYSGNVYAYSSLKYI